VFVLINYFHVFKVARHQLIVLDFSVIFVLVQYSGIVTSTFEDSECKLFHFQVVDARAVHLTKLLDIYFRVPQDVEKRHTYLSNYHTVYNAFYLSLFIY